MFAAGAGLLASPAVLAWQSHTAITRAALQSYENWDPVPFEPIDKALPALKVGGATPASQAAFVSALNIRGEKVNWDWQPAAAAGGTAGSALDVLLFSVLEPDGGMDQDLDLGPDQKYMGGYQGPSSQGIRHMYYRAWNLAAPLVTIHVPFHEMGLAPERAALFFELARQARVSGHAFWSYRFLGWGLHYIQDLGQPYHVTQFGSLKLLPFRVLMTVGWEAFMAETQRIVSNFHLAFEQYADYLMRPEIDAVSMAFKVPRGDEDLKLQLEQRTEAGVRQVAERLALSSEALVPSVVEAQSDLMGERLLDPQMVLVGSFYDSAGKPKLDFPSIEGDGGKVDQRKKMHELIEQSLSNTGVVSRWFLDRFRAVPTSQ